MPVQVDGDGDGAMPKLVLHVDRAFPVLQEYRSKNVSQIMESHLRIPPRFNNLKNFRRTKL